MDTLNRNSNSDPHPVHLAAELIAPMEEGTPPAPEAIQSTANVEAIAQPRSSTSIPTPKIAAVSWNERFWKLTLIVILLFAVALRTRGLNWDEGQHLHPDERFLTMVGTAIKLPTSLGQYFDTARSPLNPYNNNFGSFVYGTAPLFFVRLVGELIGLVDYERLVLLGRALSALADVFVVMMTFAIGRRLYGWRVGLLAALFYTLSVLPIKQSHFFTVDTFTNVPLMLAFWFTLDIIEGKRGLRAFLLTGICFGLMAASRINLVPFIGIIALAGLLRLIRSLELVQTISIRQSKPGEGQEDVAQATLAMLDSTQAAEIPPMRTFRIGPLLIEIEFKPDARADVHQAGKNPTESTPDIWSGLRPIVVGLVLVAVAAVVTFRIAQPYAFEGFFRLNPQFLEDMAEVQRLVSGENDYPPSHQWTNRTPFWFPWYHMVFWGFGPFLGFAAWLGVGLAGYKLLRHQRWEHLLILFWVIGMFLYHGQQFVKTMRYFLPLYPFLTILAAFFLFAVWDAAKALKQNGRSERLGRSAKFFSVVLSIIVIAVTLFWAMASTSIYTRTNTRVAASRWIYANISDTEVIGSEHWDDVLPLRVDGKDYYRDHEGVMLELYGEDTPEKRDKMVAWMDQVDYIILSSNRLYGSIPRLPMRFPLTTKYYEWLFNGQLGFEPVQEFTSYPEFLGISVIDDNAEEAFTVYDHPKVTIFRKTPGYSHDNTLQLMNSVDLTEVLRLKPIDATASRRQFRMTPMDLAVNRSGGTWSELFNPTDLANRFPIPIWLMMVWLIGVLTFPFTFVLFRSFADRGYAFAKALGILFVAWSAWTLSSYHILPFGRLSVLLGVFVLSVCGILIVRRHSQEMRIYLKTNLDLLLIEELIFFVAFSIGVAIRYHNPDLWHPWLGGERPMDVAFLNAILKTTYFPPYNPWFAGNYINYYYFGQLISATLIRLSGIVPELAYNLLIPIFFALTASSTYGVVFSLVLSGRERLGSSTLPIGKTGGSSILLPSVTGIFGVILVLIVGNLGEVKLAAKGLTQLGGGSGFNALASGLNKWLLNGESIPIRIGDWYWTATRVIPNTINEFPFFTFIYGDLHAHLIAIPFALLALGLAAHTVVSHSKLRWHDLGAIALVVGALRAINTWDYPTYLGLTGAAIVLKWSIEVGEDHRSEPFDWHEWLQLCLRSVVILLFHVILILVPFNLLGIQVKMELAIYLVLLFSGVVLAFYRAGKVWSPYTFVHKFGWHFLSILVLTVLLFLPYILNYATGYVSVELWRDVRTTLNEYVTVHGIFLFIITSFFAVFLLNVLPQDKPSGQSGFELTDWAVYLVPLLVLAEIALILLQLPILALVLPLLGLGLWIILHPDIRIEATWVTLLSITGILLTLLVEVIVLKGDVGRTNTVFKFYLQAWVLFGVAGAVGLGLIMEQLVTRHKASTFSMVETPAAQTQSIFSSVTSRKIRWAWWSVFSLLILAGMVYPFAATRAKMNDRYVANSPPSLNGMDYMHQATYNENNQELVLRWDYEAIQWMRQNIKGSPVVMEGNTGLYRWGNRYSIYTGLPTVIGWDWHTKQQYSLLPGTLIDYRIELVREFYSTPDQNRAMEIARRYDVLYVIVGGLERAVYDAKGLNKFDDASDMWKLVYQNEQVKIYQVQ